MKKLTIAFAAVIGLGLAGLATEANAADPFGFHFSRGGLHIAIGGHHRVHRAAPVYRHHRVHGGHAGHGGGHYDWHDTTHLDYHPPSFQRHGNHFDFVPGHYDLHRTGHWDYHRGGHRRYYHR